MGSGLEKEIITSTHECLASLERAGCSKTKIVAQAYQQYDRISERIRLVPLLESIEQSTIKERRRFAEWFENTSFHEDMITTDPPECWCCPDQHIVETKVSEIEFDDSLSDSESALTMTSPRFETKNENKGAKTDEFDFGAPMSTLQKTAVQNGD